MCLYGLSQGVQHCLKHPAAIQLLELGLFPCMPVQPGLVVSLVMLGVYVVFAYGIKCASMGRYCGDYAQAPRVLI